IKMKIIYNILIISIFTSCKNEVKQIEENATEPINKNVSVVLDPETNDTIIFPAEKYSKNIRQVTFGGDNAEAYWSFDDSKLIFQSNNKDWGVNCDQMFLMNADDAFKNSQPQMVSTGKGRTTCGYFMPDGKHVVYASTHLKI